MPSATSEMGPRVFRSRRSGSSDSAISLSIDFLAKSWDRDALLKMGLKEGVYRETPVVANWNSAIFLRNPAEIRKAALSW